MRSPYPISHRSKGFTLIELLVVIGIISVLMSLLLVMRSRIKESSNLVACQGNMRQLYQATVEYVNNNDLYLPVPSLVNENASGNGKYCAWAMVQPAVADLTSGTLWPYLPQAQEDRSRVIMCPSDSNEAARGGGATGTENRNFSYSMNHDIRNNMATLRLTQVAQPTKRVYIYEEFGPNDGACFGPGDSDDWLSGRHGGENSTLSQTRGIYSDAKWREIGKGNVCYFDGHVDLMSVAHYFADSSHFGPLTH